MTWSITDSRGEKWEEVIFHNKICWFRKRAADEGPPIFDSVSLRNNSSTPEIDNVPIDALKAIIKRIEQIRGSTYSVNIMDIT